MADAVIHIAGADVQVGSRLRQRCSWCGAVILDQDLGNVAVVAGDSRPFPTWPVGELIGQYGDFRANSTQWVVAHEDGAQLPDGCCAKLDPDATL